MKKEHVVNLHHDRKEMRMSKLAKKTSKIFRHNRKNRNNLWIGKY